MIKSLIRFLNQPVIIRPAHPGRRVWAAFWLTLCVPWPLLHLAVLPHSEYTWRQEA